MKLDRHETVRYHRRLDDFTDLMERLGQVVANADFFIKNVGQDYYTDLREQFINEGRSLLQFVRHYEDLIGDFDTYVVWMREEIDRLNETQHEHRLRYIANIERRYLERKVVNDLVNGLENLMNPEEE